MSTSDDLRDGPSKRAKRQSLDVALKVIEKSLKKQGLFKRGLASTKLGTIPTGHDDLDALLTKDGHGLARGRVISISGTEHTGKSSLALRTCGNALRSDGAVLWIDAEGSFDTAIAHINGVDTKSRSFTFLNMAAEDAGKTYEDELGFLDAGTVFDIIYKAVCSGSFDVIVLDSLAALVPSEELDPDKSTGDSTVALNARIFSRAFKKISLVCDKTDTMFIFINQLTTKMDMRTGRSSLEEPGGQRWRFHVSQWLRLSMVFGQEGIVYSYDDDGLKTRIGHYVRVKIKKNKCAPPVFDPIEIPIYYREYFPDNAKKLYDLARKLQIIRVRNSIYTYKDANDRLIFKISGESGVLSHIRDNKLEPKLAFDCKKASEGEKNKTRKPPINISAPMLKLAEIFDPKKDPTKNKKAFLQSPEGDATANEEMDLQ